jgi:DNA repair protein SbcC/Rad50
MTLRDGSLWRQWDLHVHAPTSALNNQFDGSNDEIRWKKYLDAIEQLGPIGALGITDYFSLNGYQLALEYQKQGRLQNVGILLPNVELRIIPVTDKDKAINLHLVLCPSIIHRIDELLFMNLEFEFRGNTYKCIKSGLIDLGRAFVGDSSLEHAVAYRKGIEQFKINFQSISEILKKNDQLSSHALVGVANSNNDGNSGIQHSGLLAVRNEIYRLADFIFSGNPNDRKYFLGQGKDSPEVVREKLGGLKPCIHGSDAHSLEQIGKPEKDRRTWILGDTTFEGLRQIIYEPEYRVIIGANPPATPVHRVKSVSVSLPPDTRIRWEAVEHLFCFRGKTECAFADGLTCIIGGRGSGKSTLLRLLQERLLQSNFFDQQRPLQADGKHVSVADHVTIELTGNLANAEFIEQNAVEQFAADSTRLTQSIYARLVTLDSKGQLSHLGHAADTNQQAAQQKIDLLRTQQDLRKDLIELKDRQAGLSELLTCFKDPEYISITTGLREATTRESEMLTSRIRLQSFIGALRETMTSFAEISSTPVNEYDEAINRLMLSLKAAIGDAVQDRDLLTPSSLENRVSEEVVKQRDKLIRYLENKNFSPENLHDITESPKQLADTTVRIQELEAQLVDTEHRLTLLNPSTDTRGIAEGVIRTLLEEINNRFESSHNEAKKIQLKYRFDEGAATDAAINWLVDDIGRVFLGNKPRSDHARSALERIGSPLATPSADIRAGLASDPSKAARSLEAYFGDGPNAAVWDVIRIKCRSNMKDFMRFDVSYNDKPLGSASFGQRCSAVLIVLLSLGNTPIFIDEPEAHLDSALIAGFLVDLVKRMKKNRQIIFATHNANFVVNGDAELIHILTAEEDGKTSAKSTTLEDLDDRERILSLEGGELAFRQRESRYHLSN